MMIKIIKTVTDMRVFVQEARQAGKTIGLVPTMGALHEGHLTLMQEAKSACNIVVASIFVNPTQFGPNEDFAAYPRKFENDCLLAEGVGVDAIFHPQPAEMYPPGFATYVNVTGITDKLCGLSRPGHFQGVATVVTKLFNIVTPDIAFFGQKDAQQCLVIQRMVADLNMNLKINMVPTVRDANGLALSSRNAYLAPEEARAALVLSQSMQIAAQAVKKGERDIAVLRELVCNTIQAEPRAEIDYVEIYQYPDLQTTGTLTDKALLALAVRFGKTRLIDNIILSASN
ncbi:MAG: Pantothenate synthetase [Firmicutes bacterium]|nr:Pantothenate synthetase [Bacillota bacterium]